MSFIAELKRRNVIRAAGLYLVGAWLIVQVSSTVLPMFEAPTWLPRSIVIVLAVGFIPALIFSWVFELTPDGIKRDEDVRPEESIAPQTAQRMNRAIFAVLALALLYFGFDKFVLAPRREAVYMAQAVQTSVQAAAKASAMKSIAVMPFENLSEDKANAYFATGMQDEILTRLAGIHDLKVISRTSTEQYASHPQNLKIVAAQLNVATVLEGSVQRAGDGVHINVQLIDAHTDSHLWAESYDRDLKDIFGVERDVSEKVADALKAQLLPAEVSRIARAPTQNPEAYDLFLRAGAHANLAYDQAIRVSTEMPIAIELYRQALVKDPSFALAAAGLARARMHLYFLTPNRSAALLASANVAAEQALVLQPSLGEAHLALGLYFFWGYRDYARATQEMQLAQRALPNSSTVEGFLAAIARRRGQWDRAAAGYQHAAELDPRNANSLEQLGNTYSLMRRFAEADQAYARAAAIATDPTDILISKAINTVAWKGDLVPLRMALSSLVPKSDSHSLNAINYFMLDWWSRDYSGAVKTAEGDSASDWNDGMNILLPRQLYLAWAYQAAGNNGRAEPLYRKLREQMKAALQLRAGDADLHLGLAFASAGLGDKDDAVREGREAARLISVEGDGLSGPDYLAWLAQVYVRVGENDQAIGLLRQLLALRGSPVTKSLIILDPIWDPLRNDARFQKLIADAEATQAKIGP